MADVIGWDLGGAHLKAVRVDAAGHARDAVQLPCPLWRGTEYLEQAVDHVLSSFGPAGRHAVTMTGELADIFPTRRAGVERLAAVMSGKLPGAELVFFAGRRGFVVPAQVAAHAGEIASANWLASAQFAARKRGSGVFVDMGSTTTDIVLLHAGNAQAQGSTDAERLATEELVYTGVVRTPVMAVARRVPFKGQWQRLAAEHFATMADVLRLTGQLDPEHDMAETADGAGKTPQESARRLARMVGRDLEDAAWEDWIGLAHFLADAQLRDVRMAVERVLSAGTTGKTPLIGAGAGSFAVRELARQTGRSYADFSELIEGADDARHWAAVCAPAFAVAWLAREQA